MVASQWRNNARTVIPIRHARVYGDNIAVPYVIKQVCYRLLRAQRLKDSPRAERKREREIQIDR